MKIIKYRKRNSRGKYELVEQCHIHVNVNNETANVHHVNDAIKDAWGEEYRLVTCDGIELDDSATTQDKQAACRLCMLSLMINILP